MPTNWPGMRNFFQNAPVSFWLEDCTELLERLTELKGTVEDLEQHFIESPAVVAELADLVEVIEVNEATLTLCEADNMEQLLGGLDKVLLPDSYPIFMQELLALSRGEETFVGEAVHGTLRGGRRHVRVSLTMLPETEDGRHLGIVCMEDQTETRALAQANAELESARKFLGAVVDNIPDMVFVKEAEELRFVRFNHAGERLLGLPTEKLQGKNDYDFFPKDEADFFTAKDREVLASKEICDIPKEPIETPLGLRWLHTKKVPIMGEDGEPAYLLGISEDITERLKAEEERARLFEILEGTPAIVGLAGTDGRVEYVNSAARALHSDRETPQTIDEYHFEQGARLLRNHALPTAVKHGAWSGELIWRGIADQPVVTLAIVQAHRGHDGEVSAFSVVAHDIGALKEAEDELERRAEALERSNRDLQQFAYVASHDLQEPLRMVASFCQLLSEMYGEQLDDQGREWLAYAVDGAQRMQTLIKDLLDYSRVGTRGRPFKDVDLHECCGGALRDLTLAVSAAEADIQIQALPEVSGDYAQLRQVFQNLLSNAVKFRREGVPAQVVVSASRGDEFWTISVKDNGIGFEPVHASKVFGLFKRLESRQAFPGTGIGLAICEKIVQRHGGSIWAMGVPGEGATFAFTLPVCAEGVAE